MIYLIRHAISLSNIGERLVGNQIDVSLSEKGKIQAQELADSILQIPDLIILSSYLRTHQTAQPLIQKNALCSVEVWPQIHEVHFLPTRTIQNTTSKERIDLINNLVFKNGPDFSLGEDSESFNQAVHRAQEFLKNIKKLPYDKNIFIFSHSGFIKIVLMALQNKPLTLETFFNMKSISNTQVIPICLKYKHIYTT